MQGKAAGPEHFVYTQKPEHSYKCPGSFPRPAGHGGFNRAPAEFEIRPYPFEPEVNSRAIPGNGILPHLTLWNIIRGQNYPSTNRWGLPVIRHSGKQSGTGRESR